LFAAELTFDGIVRVTSGDHFAPSLGNNSSTAFKEMALKYQNMVSSHAYISNHEKVLYEKQCSGWFYGLDFRECIFWFSFRKQFHILQHEVMFDLQREFKVAFKALCLYTCDSQYFYLFSNI
jgi:hypothetical protein